MLRRVSVVLCLLAACSHRPAAGPSDERISIEYSVDRARAPRRFVLSIPERGSARVDAQKPLVSAPDARAGFFGAPLGKRIRAELAHDVDAGSLLVRHDEADLNEGVGGFLRIRRGNQSGDISLGSKDAPARELIDKLDRIVQSAVDRPVAALRLAVHARFDGPNVKVFPRFIESGIQPLEIAITRDDRPERSLTIRAILERGGRLVDEQLLRPEDVRRHAAAGHVPLGWQRVERGSSWDFPAIGVRAPADPNGVFARVEAKLSVRTEGRAPLEIEIGSALVSISEEER